MIALPGVLEAAETLQDFCLGREWRFCFIGGVAVQRWGEPRATQDVDITLLTGLGNEAAFVDELLATFVARRDDARQFALTHRVVLARTRSGIDVDVSLGAFAFEEGAVDRASMWEWSPGRRLRTCSAEDLVVFKVFAGRDRDWGDVEGILARQHGVLRLGPIRSELTSLLQLKEEPEALDKLDRLAARVSRRLGRQ